jgi:hypothetical protein
VTVQKGEGDHTWIETYAVEREDWDKMMEIEKKWKQTTTSSPLTPVISTDEDEIIPTVNDFETDDKNEDVIPFEEELDDFEDDIIDEEE